MKKTYLLLIGLLLLGFTVTTILVLLGDLLPLDNYIDQTLPYSTNSAFYVASRIIANLYFPLLPVLFVLFFLFRRRKQKVESLMLLSSFSGWALTELLLKPIFQIQCPSTYYSNISRQQELFKISWIRTLALKEFCYPSGHTVSYVVFFGYLVFLRLHYIKNKQLKWLLVILLSSVIIFVGPSRIYLHVHWTSDVIAAYFLGFAVLLTLILLRNSVLTKHSKTS